jgi:hypothetical protein
MGAFSPIHWLIIFALLAALAGGVWLLVRPRKAISAGDAPYPFQNPARLTRVLQFLLAALIVVCLVASLSEVMQYQLAQAPFTHAQAIANDMRQRIVEIVRLLVYFTTAVVFGRWIYRANANARALGADHMTFTPGWSVGWYFVPVASLWKPYQAMREIWLASKNPGHSQAQSGDRIVGWWWVGWITSNILGNISFRISMAAKDVQTLSTGSVVGSIHELFDVFAIALALVLVTRLSRMQRELYAAQSVAKSSQENAS